MANVQDSSDKDREFDTQFGQTNVRITCQANRHMNLRTVASVNQ